MKIRQLVTLTASAAVLPLIACAATEVQLVEVGPFTLQ
ncbi:hypothetical protein IW252_001931 [Zhihengliuella flava]|uniref:Uncharacterized protein n=1 Tax=Zhihengliuella flava TaxID=1285193 RepID=A0A931DA55_9MICC|nr:hypothetical protein [Zhihengliuella flava]